MKKIQTVVKMTMEKAQPLMKEMQNTVKAINTNQQRAQREYVQET